MKLKEYFQTKIGNFEEFNAEFEIDDIEHGNFAKQICEKIVDKTEKYRKILEDYLHADGSNIAVLMEIKGIADSDKDRINSIYKELVLIERKLLLLELENKEEGFLDFIKTGKAKWDEVKKGLISLISKAKESWKDDSKVIEHLNYMG